ncbi:hypothetical protein CEUSTIGMA_g6528.t1 [Chlamydomonas eustigma]|uniref:Uncharacterized protein n=1 Tax=Chlamydomonas eustigma TaxID=1157962 RepID=A0A250X7N0_9CHLO|nr:hypothetical protein CEUSTIGMA_g6528.t1 [Chlamydomonas eustigma]|eukprot:GAX79088.1 hypothetical protein CEUSTIGMA_g6528.t1 [Chlamydomonas eustigma]
MALVAGLGIASALGAATAGVITALRRTELKTRAQHESLQLENFRKIPSANLLRDGQLICLRYDERLVHAVNAPRGPVASLSDYQCAEHEYPSSALFIIKRGRLSSLKLIPVNVLHKVLEITKDFHCPLKMANPSSSKTQMWIQTDYACLCCSHCPDKVLKVAVMRSVPVTKIESWLNAASMLETVHKQREHIVGKLRGTKQCLEEERIMHQQQLDEQHQSLMTQNRVLGTQLAETRQERSDLSMIVQQLQLQSQQTPPHVQKEIDELRSLLTKGEADARESSLQLQQAVYAREEIFEISNKERQKLEAVVHQNKMEVERYRLHVNLLTEQLNDLLATLREQQEEVVGLRQELSTELRARRESQASMQCLGDELSQWKKKYERLNLVIQVIQRRTQMAEDPEPDIALRASLKKADLQQLKQRLQHLNDNRQSFCSKLVNQCTNPDRSMELEELAKSPTAAAMKSCVNENLVCGALAVEAVVTQLQQESLRGSAEFLLGRFRLGGEQAGSASSLAAWFKDLESDRLSSMQPWKDNQQDATTASVHPLDKSRLNECEMENADNDTASDQADAFISAPSNAIDSSREKDIIQDSEGPAVLDIPPNVGRYSKMKSLRIKMPGGQRLSLLKDLGITHSASNTPRSACTPSPVDSRRDSEYDILAEDDDCYDEGLSPSHVVPPNMLIAGLEVHMQSAGKFKCSQQGSGAPC